MQTKWKCPGCGAIVYSMQVHDCPMNRDLAPYTPQPLEPVMPRDWPYHEYHRLQKCDMCGSTAIDHTDMQCRINRMSKAPTEQKGGTDGE